MTDRHISCKALYLLKISRQRAYMPVRWQTVVHCQLVAWLWQSSAAGKRRRCINWYYVSPTFILVTTNSNGICSNRRTLLITCELVTLLLLLQPNGSTAELITVSLYNLHTDTSTSGHKHRSTSRRSPVMDIIWPRHPPSYTWFVGPLKSTLQSAS